MMVPIFGKYIGGTVMARNTSVSLGDHFTEFIEGQVESGRYASASDVIRAGLRLLEREEDRYDRLRVLIAESEEQYRAGNVHEVNDAFWDDLNKEVDERLKRGERPGRHVIP
jgi:antitoxin ParD1/3/4